jgi:hypothetical protein
MPRWARLTIMAVASRLVALAGMVAGSYWPRPDDDLHWIGHDGAFYWDQVPVRVLDVWGRWDTMFYWHIARFGYPGPNGGWVYHAAYWPLFPSLMRGLSVITGLETYLCGLIIAFTLYGLAIHYFDRLLRLSETPEFAERVLLVMLAYPGTHFLTCVYPESTTVFLAIFAVYAARTNRAVLAGLACFTVALARSTGIFVCVPVLIELLRGADGRFRFTPRALVVLFPAVSLAFWLGLNQQLYGDPIYFVHVQAGWGRHPSFFLAPFFSLDLSLDHHLFALGALVLTVYAFRRRERFSLTALSTLNSLLPLSTGMLRGVHRYMGTNFPLFIFLTRWLDTRRKLTAYVVVGLCVLLGFAFKWGQGYQPN